MAEAGEEVSAAKRRRTFSEGEKPSFSKPQRHIKPTADCTTESSDVTSVETDEVSELAKPEGKRVIDGEQVPVRKDRKRKRSNMRSSGEQDAELAAVPAKAVKVGDKSAAKLQFSSHSDDIVSQGDGVAKLNQGSKNSLKCSAEDVNQSVKKQKDANKSRKEKKKSKNKQKAELPRLRVISKSVVSLCSVHVCYSDLDWICLLVFACKVYVKVAVSDFYYVCQQSGKIFGPACP